MSKLRKCHHFLLQGKQENGNSNNNNNIKKKSFLFGYMHPHKHNDLGSHKRPPAIGYHLKRGFGFLFRYFTSAAGNASRRTEAKQCHSFFS